jgi:hypothetical protein
MYLVYQYIDVPVGKGSYNLLQERERFIDVESFTLNTAGRLGIEIMFTKFKNLVKMYSATKQESKTF